METQRILAIAKHAESGKSVVYVMSRDQRVADNHALLAAQAKAIELGVGLVVVFNFHYPTGVRAYEHAKFMLTGLQEVARLLESLNIPFIMSAEKTHTTLESTLSVLEPSVLYFDFSPLHGPRKQAREFAQTLGTTTYVVDTHNIIPAWVASEHQEFAAHTFRRKVHNHLETFLKEPAKVQQHPQSVDHLPESLTFKEAARYIEAYPQRSIVLTFNAGERAAHKQLKNFLSEHLGTYAQKRNNIAEDQQSGLSPYLHFGQISSLRVALEVLQTANTAPLLFKESRMASTGEHPSIEDGMNALFEEMIVRKELSDNFCFYAKSYNDLQSIPAWAATTLQKHQNDIREFIYTTKELEYANTHDEIWNAAQKELTSSGKLHGYLRMYWAKKILEWSASPQQAIKSAIYLNDAYSIDGGDPNGYVGILWSIAGLHDRPWAERPIFGMVRYMNEAGLRRKFDVEQYIDRVTTHD